MPLTTLAPLVLLSLALASDAFAVAITQGASCRPPVWPRALRLAGAFGAAQAIAPILGWAAGIAFASLIQAVDHWIAFVLLGAIGAKMIWEGVKRDPPGPGTIDEPPPAAEGWAVFALAVATSIDAAAAGFTLTTMAAPLLISVAIIGAITFVLSAAGVWLGRAGGKSLGPIAEIVGGLVLVGLGVRILFEHHAFG